MSLTNYAMPLGKLSLRKIEADPRKIPEEYLHGPKFLCVTKPFHDVFVSEIKLVDDSASLFTKNCKMGFMYVDPANRRDPVLELNELAALYLIEEKA